MRQIVPIKINGKPIEEGLVLNRWLEKRFDANKNALVACVGATGTGKTYAMLRTLENWYQYKFHRPFPPENICFSIEESAKLIRHGNLEKGEIILLEEAGVLINSLDFQNKISKFFGSVLQSFRSKNIGVIFTLPNISMLNKTARSLLHLTLQTIGINFTTNQVMIKPFYTQTNALSGKDYHKYLMQKIEHHYVKIEKIHIGLPSENLIKIYELKKDKFVNKVVEDLIDVADPNSKSKKKEKEVVINPLWEAIKALYERGITNQMLISKELDVAQQTISNNLIKMIKSGYYVPNYLERAKKYLQQPILAQPST